MSTRGAAYVLPVLIACVALEARGAREPEREAANGLSVLRSRIAAATSRGVTVTTYVRVGGAPGSTRKCSVSA